MGSAHDRRALHDSTDVRWGTVQTARAAGCPPRAAAAGGAAARRAAAWQASAAGAVGDGPRWQSRDATHLAAGLGRNTLVHCPTTRVADKHLEMPLVALHGAPSDSCAFPFECQR